MCCVNYIRLKAVVTTVRCDIRAKKEIQNTSYEISLDKRHFCEGESNIWRYKIATETLSPKQYRKKISLKKDYLNAF